MPKPKKKKRAFTATDTLWSLMEKAAASEEMSINLWMEYAARAQIKNGITKEGIDIDEAKEFAYANAMERGGASIRQLLTKLDSTKTFWQQEMNKCNLVSEELRLDAKAKENAEFDLSASAFEELDNTAKSHGTNMASLSEKLIADFLAKPKREQKRILEE